jgi:diguanylate cyclase (GGDEF)-like protein
MQNKSNTLLDKLVSLVSDDHIDEVKQIVAKLTKLNNLKYVINNNAPIKDLYKKIAYELQTEFHIFDFCIMVVNNSIENDLYQFGENSNYNYTFEYKVNDEIFFDIKLTKEPILEFDILSLNSYFEDIIHILYLRYILTDTQIFTVDPLTKLTNRISFQEEIKTLIPLALRENMTIGVLLVNIDRFRAVNDEHGDEFGDNFLKLYANTIKKTIRTSDIAVRFGGGEFLVLLINVDNESRVESIANNLKNKLTNSYLKAPNGDKFKKTICIGISTFPQDTADINEAVKKAEVALAGAQSRGRNQIFKYKKEEISAIEFF